MNQKSTRRKDGRKKRKKVTKDINARVVYWKVVLLLKVVLGLFWADISRIMFNFVIFPNINVLFLCFRKLSVLLKRARLTFTLIYDYLKHVQLT